MTFDLWSFVFSFDLLITATFSLSLELKSKIWCVAPSAVGRLEQQIFRINIEIFDQSSL